MECHWFCIVVTRQVWNIASCVVWRRSVSPVWFNLLSSDKKKWEWEKGYTQMHFYVSNSFCTCGFCLDSWQNETRQHLFTCLILKSGFYTSRVTCIWNQSTAHPVSFLCLRLNYKLWAGFTSHLACPLSWLSSTLIPPHNKWTHVGQHVSPPPPSTATPRPSHLLCTLSLTLFCPLSPPCLGTH